MEATLVNFFFTAHDGVVLLSAFSKGSKRFSLHAMLYAELQAGSSEYQFSEVILAYPPDRPSTRIKLRVHRFGGESSTNRPITGC